MKGKKILLIEDDESIRESTKEVLELEGYIVQCARNGKEGMQVLRGGGELPHLILLDLMMPVSDGFQFRLEQKNEPAFKHIPVVLMTADGHETEKKEQLGAEGFLKKPADIDAILEVVKQCCL